MSGKNEEKFKATMSELVPDLIDRDSDNWLTPDTVMVSDITVQGCWVAVP